MKRADIIDLLKRDVTDCKNHDPDPYYQGRIAGLKTALYFLDDKETVAELEKKIRPTIAKATGGAE